MQALYAALETIRSWISLVALLGLLEFARRRLLQNRKLRIAENKDDREGTAS